MAHLPQQLRLLLSSGAGIPQRTSSRSLDPATLSLLGFVKQLLLLCLQLECSLWLGLEGGESSDCCAGKNSGTGSFFVHPVRGLVKHLRSPRCVLGPRRNCLGRRKVTAKV